MIEKLHAQELEIQRTYQVINWCEYDGQAPPVIVGRDEDGNGILGDEAVYVVVETINEPDPCRELIRNDQDFHYQHVWFDSDSDPFNRTEHGRGFWRELAPFIKDEIVDATTPQNDALHCETMASNGYWQYTRYIHFGLEENELNKGFAKRDGIEWRSNGNPYFTSKKRTDHTDRSALSIGSLQNNPNPFSGETAIHFILSKATEIRLIVYNSRGRVLQECRRACDAGSIQIGLKLDQDAPAGLYYYLLSDGRQTLGSTMVLQRE